MNCVFCKIINGELPSYKLYEDEKILIFLDINPYCTGHTLIIPKEHTLDLNTIPEDTLNLILKYAREWGLILMDKLKADGYTIIENNGNVQEVKHFHLHVIPKYNNEEKLPIEEVYKKITQE